MKQSTQLTLRALAMSTLICLPVALSFAVQQQEPKEEKSKKEVKHVLKHKVIQIKKSSNEPTTLEIDNNGEIQVIELQAEDIESITMLEDKLSSLDEGTRQMVLKLVQDIDINAHGELHPETIEKLRLKNSENVHEELILELESMSEGKQFLGNKKVFIINDGEGLHFDGVLKGHHEGIIKLIEKGEFTRDELNAIRKALDAKY